MQLKCLERWVFPQYYPIPPPSILSLFLSPSRSAFSLSFHHPFILLLGIQLMHRLFLVHPPRLDSLAAFKPPAMPIAFHTCGPYALHLYTILQNHTKSASSKVHAEFQSLIDSHLQYCPKSVFGLHLANNTHSITALFRKVKNMSDSIREQMHTGF